MPVAVCQKTCFCCWAKVTEKKRHSKSVELLWNHISSRSGQIPWKRLGSTSWQLWLKNMISNLMNVSMLQMESGLERHQARAYSAFPSTGEATLRSRTRAVSCLRWELMLNQSRRCSTTAAAVGARRWPSLHSCRIQARYTCTTSGRVRSCKPSSASRGLASKTIRFKRINLCLGRRWKGSVTGWCLTCHVQARVCFARTLIRSGNLHQRGWKN